MDHHEQVRTNKCHLIWLKQDTMCMVCCQLLLLQLTQSEWAPKLSICEKLVQLGNDLTTFHVQSPDLQRGGIGLNSSTNVTFEEVDMHPFCLVWGLPTYGDLLFKRCRRVNFRVDFSLCRALHQQWYTASHLGGLIQRVWHPDYCIIFS